MVAMLSAQDHSLVAAVDRRDATAIQRALLDGADVNCSWGYNYETPLMEAIYSGNEKIVRILLEAGAAARGNNSLKCTPLQIACEEGHLSLVEMLLSYDNGLLEIQNKKGQTPLFAAVYWGHIDVVRFLLDRGANVHAAPSCMAFSDVGLLEGGRTALMFTCREGNLAMVRLLLAAGVEVEARDESRTTALHDAATSLSRDMVRELILQHNANIFAVDKDGNTPFDWIPLHQHRDPSNKATVDQFLDAYSNRMTHDHGRLALHAILEAAEYAFVENRAFHPPRKPLLEIHLPLGTLQSHHFRSLLSTFDTNLIRNRDENGKLPVHIAIQNRAPVEVLSMLVDLDAATLHIADYAGALPLHECCYGYVVDDSSVRFLVEQGGVGSLAARTREGGALPLHALCGSTNPSLRTVQYMIRSFPGSVTARTNAGQYPFVMAACESSTVSLSVVYELVRANPDLVIPK